MASIGLRGRVWCWYGFLRLPSSNASSHYSTNVLLCSLINDKIGLCSRISHCMTIIYTGLWVLPKTKTILTYCSIAHDLLERTENLAVLWSRYLLPTATCCRVRPFQRTSTQLHTNRQDVFGPPTIFAKSDNVCCFLHFSGLLPLSRCREERCFGHCCYSLWEGRFETCLI